MRAAAIVTLFATALAAAACATHYNDDDRRYGPDRDRGDYAYVGEDYERLGNDCGFFAGSGGNLLDPWLACTREGQGLVRARSDLDRDRSIDADAADEANVYFRRHSDTDRDMRLTDGEIKAGLVNHARFAGNRRD